MAYGTINADQIGTSVANTSLGAGNASIMKNRIINGAMVVSQRNGTTAVTCTNLATTFGVDRFSVYKDNSSATTTIGQSSTAPTGFVNSTIFSVTTGSAPTAANECQFRQVIEGYNVADLGFGTANAKTITISFWVQSSLTGTFAFALQNGASSLSYIATYTISSANTWEQKTITITGPSTGTWLTTNGNGLTCIWDLGGGSNFAVSPNAWTAGNVYTTSGTTKVIGTTGATFYITGVQLEVGSSATGFEYVNYQTSLANCQRYYQKYTQPPLRGLTNGSGIANRMAMVLPVVMRTAPSSTLGGVSIFDGSSITTVISISTDYSNANTVEYDFTQTAALNTTRPCIVYQNGTASLQLSAEL